MTLTEFLLARLAEDETPFLARLRGFGGRRSGKTYIRRVLTECEAKRRIILEAADLLDSWEHVQSGTPGLAMWPDVSRRERSQASMRLSMFALSYADHPDYDEAWRP